MKSSGVFDSLLSYDRQHREVRKHLARVVATIFFFFVPFGLAGCATYSAKPIEAWVVDADTGQPLAGVNVVAHWTLIYGFEGGGFYELEIMEDVTAQNGRFSFSGWGPKEIPSGLPCCPVLKNDDPAIVFFRAGYKSRVVGNNKPFEAIATHGASVRFSEWNGKKIPMRKFDGTLDEYVLELKGTLSSLYFIGYVQDCEWKKLPRMVLALTKEVTAVKRQRPRAYFTLESIDDLPRQAECGSAREFLKGHQQ